MLDLWTRFSLVTLDWLLGWTLRLSPEVALILVALLSAFVLTLVRLFTTNQDLLRRAAADKRRLRELVREARRRRDKAAVRRHKATMTTVALRQFRAEGWPLLVSLLPIAMLATWCFHRLAYHPPRGDEPVELVAYTPVSSVESTGIMHIVPQAGLRADGWVRPIVAADYHGQPTGLTRWQLTSPTRAEPLLLELRYRDRTVTRELRIGQSTYSEPFIHHDADLQTELRLRPVKLFGIIPGLPHKPMLGMPADLLPPWMVGYLIIVIPFVVVLKRILRIR